MKRLIAAALCACAMSGCTEHAQVAAPPPQMPAAPEAPAEPALSDGATKIVAAMRARPDGDTVCVGGDAFRDAMRETVIKLMMAGELAGNPRSDAESAAAYLHAHCGQSAPASAPNPPAK